MASSKMPPRKRATRPSALRVPSGKTSEDPSAASTRLICNTSRAGIAAIDQHVAGPAQMPAEERKSCRANPWQGCATGTAGARTGRECRRCSDDSRNRYDRSRGTRSTPRMSTLDARRRQNQPRPGSRAAVREAALPIDSTDTATTCRGRSCRGRWRDQVEDRPPPVERGHAISACVRSAGRRGPPERAPSACVGAVGVAAVTAPSARRALPLAGAVDVAAEDHLAGGRLQHARDDDVDVLADHLAARCRRRPSCRRRGRRRPGCTPCLP